ncbi:PEP-CTERM sorting domain-containing protein [Roseomonas sp. BN140053]|uniref:PEP-CTERM sorting domain-containing protein n=1 Tax=Roseomonas sp. BN140053 TaxID=3391898 RepID=UPI0039E9A194
MRLGYFLRAASFSVALLSAGTSFAATIVTSPQGLFTNPDPTNAAGPGAGLDSWFANNVRANGSAGITSTFARSGNGSIEFRGPAGAITAKADFEYWFSPASQFLLSQLGLLSFDWYRDPSSTAAAHLHPSLRLLVSDFNGHMGYLVYEGIYNNTPTTQGVWNTVNVVGGGTDKFIWNTGSLNPTLDYGKTAADWAALLPNLTVIALSTGIGSGWNGSFAGGVDNISYSVVGGAVTTFNFETTAAAVPEPASLALFGLGLAALGLVRRRKAA